MDARSLLQKADSLQQRHPWLAVPVATWKKFSDDQAGNLAALIAYFAFASLFPLLLVAVTILDIVLRHDAHLREQLIKSALHSYPVVGPQLENSGIHGMTRTGLALVIGLLLTAYASLGVATAMQNAMNTAWGVPQFRRPRFPWSKVRSLGVILILGPGQIITISLSSIAGGAGHLSGALGRVAATLVAVLLNIGLFWIGFRIATATEVRGRDMRLGAILAAVVWQVLQSVGGYFVGHQLHTNSAYGVFAVVLGLLAWFYLEAQITLFVVELDVVRARRLWPRTIAPPPISEADLRAYQLYAKASQRRPELDIEVRPAPPAAGEPGPPDRQ
jgi:membrane protein